MIMSTFNVDEVAGQIEQEPELALCRHLSPGGFGQLNGAAAEGVGAAGLVIDGKVACQRISDAVRR
jgi:hypothetical protein